MRSGGQVPSSRAEGEAIHSPVSVADAVRYVDGILEALRSVYGATRVLEELGFAKTAK